MPPPVDSHVGLAELELLQADLLHAAVVAEAHLALGLQSVTPAVAAAVEVRRRDLAARGKLQGHGCKSLSARFLAPGKGRDGQFRGFHVETARDFTGAIGGDLVLQRRANGADDIRFDRRKSCFLDDGSGHRALNVVAPAEGSLRREQLTPRDVDQAAVEFALPHDTQLGIAVLNACRRVGEIDVTQYVLQREGGELRNGGDLQFRNGERVDQGEAERYVDRNVAAQPAIIVEHLLGQAQSGPCHEPDDVLGRARDR